MYINEFTTSWQKYYRQLTVFPIMLVMLECRSAAGYSISQLTGFIACSFTKYINNNEILLSIRIKYSREIVEKCEGKHFKTYDFLPSVFIYVIVPISSTALIRWLIGASTTSAPTTTESVANSLVIWKPNLQVIQQPSDRYSCHIFKYYIYFNFKMNIVTWH